MKLPLIHDHWQGCTVGVYLVFFMAHCAREENTKESIINFTSWICYAASTMFQFARQTWINLLVEQINCCLKKWNILENFLLICDEACILWYHIMGTYLLIMNYITWNHFPTWLSVSRDALASNARILYHLWPSPTRV